jgi:hypothetical protein
VQKFECGSKASLGRVHRARSGEHVPKRGLELTVNNACSEMGQNNGEVEVLRSVLDFDSVLRKCYGLVQLHLSLSRKRDKCMWL